MCIKAQIQKCLLMGVCVSTVRRSGEKGLENIVFRASHDDVIEGEICLHPRWFPGQPHGASCVPFVGGSYFASSTRESHVSTLFFGY